MSLFFVPSNFFSCAPLAIYSCCNIDLSYSLNQGAAQGHACSAVTIANLARLGNKDVLTRYKCHQLASKPSQSLCPGPCHLLRHLPTLLLLFRPPIICIFTIYKIPRLQQANAARAVTQLTTEKEVVDLLPLFFSTLISPILRYSTCMFLAHSIL